MPKDEYAKLRAEYPALISKEQFYKIAHISKRHARYLLQSGLVPCTDTGKKTRCYKVALSDAIHYLRDRKRHPKKYMLPKEPPAPLPVLPTLPDLEQQLHLFYREQLAEHPDVLPTNEVARLTGYDRGTVINWIERKWLIGMKAHGKYVIPKACLIDFLSGEHYRESMHKTKKQYKEIEVFIEWLSEKSSS